MVALGKVHDLAFETVDGEGLRRGYLQHTVDVDDDLVEVWIILLKILESLVFIEVEYLFFDPDSLSLLLLQFLL